jgi:putative ABC transport system permease protein
MSPEPPRFALWLLRRTLSPERYETVTGDLEEIFRLEQQLSSVSPRGARRARRWFWRQTISIVTARCLPPPRLPPRLPLWLLAPPRKGDRMQGLRQDIRYAVRTLLKTPGFTFVAILTLALGIGGTTAIFTLVNALLLKPLPFKEPAQLMMVHIKAPDPRAGAGMYRDMVWSYPKYQAFKANRQAFQDSALFTPAEWTVTGASEPERVRGEIIDARYLPVLGVLPQIGRNILPEEDAKPGIEPLVLISQALWQRRFGGDPNIVGQTISLNAIPHTVIGILPAGFRGLTGDAQVWVPLMSSSNSGYLVDLNQPRSHSYFVIARRGDGVSEEQAKAEAELIGSRVDALYSTPKPEFLGTRFSARAVSLDDTRLDPLMRRAVFVLLGAVCAVLLIGCVNLANLLLARSLTRQREVAIRLAIGATRARVVQQFLTESALLAGAGAVAGVLVALGAIKIAGLLMPEAGIVLPRGSFLVTRVGIGMIALDATTLLFALGTAAVTAILFGLLPAWQASRADVTHAIKAGGAGSIGRGTRGASVRTLLIVAETALALVLLVAAGLMLRSVKNLQSTELGFQPDGVVTVQFELPGARYDRPHATLFITQLLDQLRVQPGVQSVAYGYCAPLSGGCNGTTANFPDRPLPPGTDREVGVTWTSSAWFETMGVRVLKGRAFTDRDREGQPKVMIVSETAARNFWPGEDPIGKRIAVGQGGFGGDGGEVVGVVADVRYRTVETAPRADTYLPLLQSPRSNGIVFIRSPLDVSSVVSIVRAELRRLDPDLPLGNIKTMGNRFGDATWRTRLSADLLGLFAGLALLLAAIGLYGVTAQGVEQRAREIGVRMALGANRARIFRLVIGRALIIGAIGVAVGVGLSVFAMGQLEALLYQVKPHDPITITGFALVLIAVTLLASYLPARRATRVDPLTSLRAE